MITSYKKFWNNFLDASGTASRSDYWWPVIINFVLGALIVNFIQGLTGHPITEIYNVQDLTVSMIRNVAIIVLWFANLTVSIRRLHDTDRSGWWVLISIIPFIGTIWKIILMLLPSKPSRWN
ncbi:DUF805 domain-containing protein [Weissella diestrammenae]|uniref:DUF805 domain-containing protein n=1 Tax=Weissella diestrammenae TaxID=1162633 RepID=A0A7G9T4F7_9LACO|nr:DUF805 domain-containing protein [Weissella diestrammenae]MCM0583518.1 DUF805 domain-containing protein [Weissella diestrammenae]QNN74982.1 DUF805 domain-containing protein [Weissella diestrammenae]